MGIAYNTSIVRDGLVLHLDAANPKSYPGSGTTWYDLSGNGNNGTLVNGVGYSTDNKGSMVFDGVNDTIDCGTVYAIGSSLTGFTISMWVKTQSSSTRILAENGTGFTTNTFYLAQENNTNLTFLVFGEGSFDLVQISSPAPYPTNTWFNLVGVWSSGVKCKLFYNGEDRTAPRGGSIRNNLIDGNTNLFLGSRAGSSLFHSGNISYTQIYNRALTAAEIKQNFEAMRGRYGI
jgi:hypothetical protein